MDRSVRNYIAEFLGTFALVFIGTAVATLTGIIPGHDGARWLEISFAFGGTLMVLVWVIGPVSGCHINPAVTIPMALAGRLKWADVPGYIIAQLAGALVASGILIALLKGFTNPELTYSLAEHGVGANGNPQGMATGALLGWEVILTALFLFTIFTATRQGATPGFEGLAIGGFLFVAHLVGAQLGDSSLNPARSFGPALIQGGDALRDLWIFIVGPLIGGIIGWVLYKIVHADK